MKRAIINWDDNLQEYNISLLNSKSVDAANNKLRGKVKSIKESSSTATVKFDEVIKGKQLKNITAIFNTDGNIVEHSVFKNKKVSSKVAYSYDGIFCIEEREFRPDGSMLATYSYQYNEKGERVEEEIHNDGGVFEAYKCKYNKDGFVVEKRSVTSDCNSFTYTYSNDSITIMETDHKGRVENKKEYLFDQDGKFKECRIYEPKKSLFSTKFILKENISIFYNTIGDIVKYNQSTFDTDDDNTDSNSCSYKYVYDSNNNWISRIMTDFDGSTYVTEREIEYYE